MRGRGRMQPWGNSRRLMKRMQCSVIRKKERCMISEEWVVWMEMEQILGIAISVLEAMEWEILTPIKYLKCFSVIIWKWMVSRLFLTILAAFRNQEVVLRIRAIPLPMAKMDFLSLHFRIENDYILLNCYIFIIKFNVYWLKKQIIIILNERSNNYLCFNII